AAETVDDGRGRAGTPRAAGGRRRHRPHPHCRGLRAPDGRDLRRLAALEDRGQLVAAHRQPRRHRRSAERRRGGRQRAPPAGANLMRRLYSLLWWLALPLVLGRLWWRGRREPGYRQHLGERLGFYGGRSEPRLTI